MVTMNLLKQMYEDYDSRIADCRNELLHIDTEYLENKKFLALLESEEKKVFRDFTPREIENQNMKKISEITERQKLLSMDREKLQYDLDHCIEKQDEVQRALVEVREMEMTARDSKWFEENYYNAGTENEEPIVGAHRRLDPDTSEKIEIILNYILDDPVRAKRELEKLLS